MEKEVKRLDEPGRLELPGKISRKVREVREVLITYNSIRDINGLFK